MFFKLSLLISHFVIIESMRATTDLLLTRVGPCFDSKTTIGKISEFRVTTQAYSSKLSGVMNFSRNISNGWVIKATMEKCMDIRNTDTCDPFRSFFVVNNGCGSGAEKDQQSIYGTFFNYTKPKMRCPIQAGRYELQDYPFNSKDNYVTVFESKVSTSVFGYMFRLDGYTHDWKRVFCIETYLQLLYKRNHSWTSNSKKEQVTTSGPQTTVENEED